ncbi:MAG: hypothetical protein QOJ13_2917 [Gaiellales bacterium]|nr:hypothetical protein [Gaiellales bacterium]
MSAGAHLATALAAEREGHERLLQGEDSTDAYRRARDAYLSSHAEMGARSWGRLIGALKMAVLAADGVEAVARQAVDETTGVDPGPAAAYARALGQVALGAAPDVREMLTAGDAFERTGRALAALGAGDGEAFEAAVGEIRADFAERQEHLAGVAIADTAVVLERLAAGRGLTGGWRVRR